MNILTKIKLPNVKHLKSGKVREIFDLNDRLLIVTTDRISAFDCILPTGINKKGHILNKLSMWWFNLTKHIINNHCITDSIDQYPNHLKKYSDLIEGRSMIVRKLNPIQFECVVRGYLIGSAWKDYQDSGSVCGIKLRSGYKLASKLDEPIFTPSTKSENGHDQNITFDEMKNKTGEYLGSILRDKSLELYNFAAKKALQKGIIIADTKFEFSIYDGLLMIIDEVLTPDSSRFWDVNTYNEGINPDSYDKQYVRDYLFSLEWNKNPPAPELPEYVVEKTSSKYSEIYFKLTGEKI